MRLSTRLRAALLVTAIGAGIAATVLTGSVDAQPGKPVFTAASNRHAAWIDAVEHVDSLVLPPEAASSATEPAGGGHRLKPSPRLTATPTAVDVHGWWRVPGSPESVLAGIEARPPGGASLSESGSGGDQSGQIGYSWPPTSGVLGERRLVVTVVPLPDGTTGLLAQAESIWIVPRLADQRISKRAHEIDVTSAKLPGPVTLSRTVANRGKVSRIVSLINAMPLAPPGGYSCPAISLVGAHLATFTFRAGPQGRRLATASYWMLRGLTDSSGPCNPVVLSIPGHHEVSLVGGSFVVQAERILNFSLTGGR